MEGSTEIIRPFTFWQHWLLVWYVPDTPLSPGSGVVLNTVLIALAALPLAFTHKEFA